jgi:hypothetical protein
MTQIVSYALPAELWQPSPRANKSLDVIQDLTQEIIAVRRRLEKQVNEDVERDRYHATCELLEQAVQRWITISASAERFESFVNDTAYFDLLTYCWLERSASNMDAGSSGMECWLGASVIPPDRIQDYIYDLQAAAVDSDWFSRRMEFLERVLAQGAGLVECQIPADDGEMVNLSFSGNADGRDASGIYLETQQGGRVDVEEVFRNRVLYALTSGGSVNMNNQNHVVITHVLAEFVTVREECLPGKIRVIYGDGSEAPPFPLLCLKPAIPQRDEFVVPVSLMSMRHLLLDPSVVRNWLRNREIDQDSTLARADIYCYQHAVTEFRGLRSTVNHGQRLCMHLYHTGYEPAIVGVYRAAVETIRDHGDWLRVVPHFYVETGFETGPSWPPIA